MASYNKFQSDNKKYTKEHTRTDINNPDFVATVSSRNTKQLDKFEKNLDKWVDFVSWARFCPDGFLDLITPETGGIKLDLDQRIFLRCMARFVSVYGVFPRGWGKTFLEVLGMYITAIFYPDIYMAITAQTKENSASLLEAKHKEIIKFYPLIKDEISKAQFSNDKAEVSFSSGAVINILANAQSSKGQRRHRVNIEESALLNNELFQDALEPIPSEPRRTIGKLATINPEELNGSISFFTTSGFRNSSEFQRNILMLDEMAELKGKMVLGSDWRLGESFGRGRTKSKILSIKASSSPIAFDMNYMSIWTGCVDNALVDINKLLNLRTLTDAKSKSEKNDEIYLGVDVARSQDASNNQSSVAVLEVKRSKNNRISQIMLINLVTISNSLNFTAQALEVKKIKKLYNASAVCIDSNGLGAGLVDTLLQESFDPIKGESLGCWNTMNTDNKPEIKEAECCLYALTPQSAQTDIIVNFIDMVESGKLRLLEKKQDANYDLKDKENYKENIVPFLQTDALVEEISNLQLKPSSNGKLAIEKVIKKIDKDRFSALAYGLWYIKTFEDNAIEDEDSLEDYFQMF